MSIYRQFSVLALAVLVSLGLSVGTASADEPTVEEIAQQFLAANPGGEIVGGNEVVYPDGSGFVALKAGTYALSQCTSDKFCMWTNASYTGSFTYVTGSGVTKTLSGTVKSFWNNRTKAARLYNNAGTSSTCYAAGIKVASVSSSYQSPAKVYLSSGTSC